MIIINSTETRFGYSVKSSIKGNKEQLTFEFKAFIEHMLQEEPELMNAVFANIMPEITESSNNMDPVKFGMYTEVLKRML